MKVCFALLVDYKLSNYARRLALELDEKYKLGFVAAKLPQHITLGPSFEVDDIRDIEKIFDAVAETAEALEVKLTDLDLKVFGNEEDSLGIIWMDFEENKKLQELHNSIYRFVREMGWKQDSVPGDDVYHFHSTISLA